MFPGLRSLNTIEHLSGICCLLHFRKIFSIMDYGIMNWIIFTCARDYYHGDDSFQLTNDLTPEATHLHPNQSYFLDHPIG